MSQHPAPTRPGVVQLGLTVRAVRVWLKVFLDVIIVRSDLVVSGLSWVLVLFNMWHLSQWVLLVFSWLDQLGYTFVSGLDVQSVEVLYSGWARMGHDSHYLFNGNYFWTQVVLDRWSEESRRGSLMLCGYSASPEKKNTDILNRVHRFGSLTSLSTNGMCQSDTYWPLCTHDQGLLPRRSFSVVQNRRSNQRGWCCWLMRTCQTQYRMYNDNFAFKSYYDYETSM